MPGSLDLLLPLRYGWRLSLAAAHLCAACLIVALLFPALSYRRRRGCVRLWSASFCAALGLRVRLRGAPPPAGAALVLANHVSWLDIFAINVWQGCRFVAKAEVGGWPLIGWLCRHAGTLFISRQRRRDTGRIRHQMVHGLQRGHALAVFPEGTTSAGATVLPFNPSLLQAALDSGSPVYAITLRYRQAGRPSAIPAYIDDMSLAASLHAILKARALEVELRVEEPIEDWTSDRRQLAELCRRRMLERLDGP